LPVELPCTFIYTATATTTTNKQQKNKNLFLNTLYAAKSIAKVSEVSRRWQKKQVLCKQKSSTKRFANKKIEELPHLS